MMQPGSGTGGDHHGEGATGTTASGGRVNGGRFDFDDGGTYCGGWDEGKAHGHGVCTGPKGQGAYSGSWHYGFEVSGVYTWPSGSCYEGQWQNGKRHGLGVETRGRWIYRGEWTQGFKGRYGVRQSNTSLAKYEGTWANGLQDGYGSETYADEGTYQGQWMRGMRHGYGIRKSATFGKACKYRAGKALRTSLTSLHNGDPAGDADGPHAEDHRDRRVDDTRGGFVLKMNSTEHQTRRWSLGGGGGQGHAVKRGLLARLKKQRSTGELEKRGSSVRSTGSSGSWVSTDSGQSAMTDVSIPSDSNASFVIEDESMDPSITETYMGEWKNDKRSGYGVSERSDGLKYEGEWYANKKYGYGITTFPNGEKEEGKYKNNVLITSQKKRLFLMRSAKFRERIDAAVNAAQRASKIALQKSDIAINRTATAKSKAEQADIAAAHAREDSDVAEAVAKQYAPDFHQPGLERLKARQRAFREMQRQMETVDHTGARDQQQTQPQTQQVQIQMQQNKAPLPQNQMPNQVPQHIPQKSLNQDSYQTQSNQQLQNVPPTQQINYQPNPSQRMPQHSLHAQQTTYFNDVGPQTQLQNSLENSAMMQNQPGGPPPNRYNVPNDGSNPGTRNVMHNEEPQAPNPGLRRMSRRVSRPSLGSIGQQNSIDHFDHYQRSPSRDSSVDRYSRATDRLHQALNAKQPSVERTIAASRPSETPDRTLRAPSAVRGTTPAPMQNNPSDTVSVGSGKKNSLQTDNGSIPNQSPFEDIILKKRGLGQDIIPSPNQPKRTESLFVPNQPPVQATKNVPVQTSLQRKKSLPDFQELPRTTGPMSREETSYLSSARREEIRRQQDERERLRTNPLLYLVSPQFKAWFTRQQLFLVVLFINISLAIMFFKLLT